MAVYLLASKVVAIALSQVGYKESGTNVTKYAKDLDAINWFNTKKQGTEWCDIFVDWCVWQASGEDKDRALKALYEPKKDNCGAGCKYSARYFRANNAWSKTARVGDQIFFGKEGSETHTGIVVAVGVSTISTVEGNKGNAVKKCSYSKNDSKIAGYGRIKYESEPQPAPTPTPTPKGDKVMIELNVLKQGSKGNEVKTLQRLLKELGYKGSDKKVLAIDGSFGSNTLYAVKAFQKASKLEVDGSVGQKTWDKLLKG